MFSLFTKQKVHKSSHFMGSANDLALPSRLQFSHYLVHVRHLWFSRVIFCREYFLIHVQGYARQFVILEDRISHDAFCCYRVLLQVARCAVRAQKYDSWCVGEIFAVYSIGGKLQISLHVYSTTLPSQNITLNGYDILLFYHIHVRADSKLSAIRAGGIRIC